MSKEAQRSGGRRLLMLDDSELALEIQVMMFERKGFEVKGCLDLDEVREAAASFAPDIIVTDAGLGEATVYEAVSTLRELFDRVPVVLFSGRQDDELAALAAELAVEGWASKGARQQEVLAKVVAVLEGRIER